MAARRAGGIALISGVDSNPYHSKAQSQRRPVWEARAMPRQGAKREGLGNTNARMCSCGPSHLAQVRGPKKKSSAELVDSEDPPSRGRAAKRAVRSDGGRRAPNLGEDSRGRSRSREEDKEPPYTQLDDLTLPGDDEPMDMESNQQTVQHHSVHLEAEDYHDALKKGWQEVDQLGVGDCGSIASAMWTLSRVSKTKKA